MSLPLLLVIADRHLEVLGDEFRARYARDYAIETVTSAAAGTERLRRGVAEGDEVAMVVAEAELSDGSAIETLREAHAIVPTARRIALVPIDRYRELLPAMHQATADSDFDTFVGIPRGARDEEFHTVIVEALSEWGWSVAKPVVSMVDIVTAPGDPNAAAIHDLLDRLGWAHRKLHVDSEEARPLVEAAGPGAPLPIVRNLQGELLVGATAQAVAERMYSAVDDIPPGTVADVAVIGAGPAGLAVAVTAASEGLSTVVLESEAIGGQAGTSSLIRNYLGFPRGVSGMRLTQRARVQALRFGAEFYTGRAAVRIEPGPPDEPEHHHVLVGGTHLCARTVVLATGVAYRRLGVESVEALVGNGVFYGSATSFARFASGRHVVVVGGGNSAGQAALHLARFARKVSIVVRRARLDETMSAYLVREIAANPTVEVTTGTRVVGAEGDPMLQRIELEDIGSLERRSVEVDAMFLMLGATPACGWLPDEVARDDHDFVLTGREVPMDAWVDGCPPAALETTVPGIYAAGDVRAGSMKRVASASGEGASVLPMVHARLAELRAQQLLLD
ncbi:FAD-dependent oxidoreductase [Agrococcus sp. ARC_14]|uniref:FAD-dependent oxidoreductase n=1 Tax=Agrococcus sp. ARC_14 TaxID=2919927 RepID=UPI001F05599A|nr:FAD-dependent oxidoreductase [Agrococcus sp. ARC_14]MCH1881547.1 FAD-dependent oxidoreductase [Agrococcus sp. ARC_14]